MNDFVVTVNSTVDLPKEWLSERQVPVIPLKYTLEGETYEDMTGCTGKAFFDKLRAGETAVTSQVNPQEARTAFEPILKEGKDILHLAFSSALSGTYESMVIAADALSIEYPDRKIIVVDTLCACMGEGLLLYYVLKMRASGKSIEEVAEWAEENKLHVIHHFTVNDLHHLHRGGRVSKTTAVLGSMVQIKPMLHVDDAGTLQMTGTARGRKKSLSKLVDRTVESSRGWKNEIIMITHGDCPEEAEYVAGLVRERMEVDNILIHCIGNVIGSHTGPGVVGLFTMGNQR